MITNLNVPFLRRVILAVFTCLVFYGQSSEKEWPREKQLWRNYQAVIGDSRLEISALQDLMKYYFGGVSNIDKVDSVSILCLRVAKKSENQKHILDAHEAYFKYGARISKKEKNWNYIENIKSLSPFPSCMSTTLQLKLILLN